MKDKHLLAHAIPGKDFQLIEIDHGQLPTVAYGYRDAKDYVSISALNVGLRNGNAREGK